MNNKPIIIDGVNVAGCEYIEHSHLCKKFKEYALCKITDIGAVTACIEKRNCYYKQLQRKIQECEKLRESNQAWGLTVSHLREELEEEKKKAMWIKDGKIWYSEEEYKELEEKINQQHKNIMLNNQQYHDIDQKNKQYKQALDEIRDLAEKLRTKTDYHCLDEVNSAIDEILRITKDV